LHRYIEKPEIVELKSNGSITIYHGNSIYNTCHWRPNCNINDCLAFNQAIYNISAISKKMCLYLYVTIMVLYRFAA